MSTVSERTTLPFPLVERRWSALAQIARALPRIANEDELVALIVDGMLEFFPQARSAQVFASDVDAKQSRLYCRERGGTGTTTLCGGIDALPESQRAEFAETRLIAADGVRGAMMSAPVLEGGALMGLVVIEAEPGAQLTDEDHAALAGVAAQASIAMQQLRARQRRLQASRLERDLEAAGRVQRSFLPAPRAINGFAIATEYRPAYDVGGDFYDVIVTGDDEVVAVIGDVAGKGVAGALMMSRVSSDIRRLATSGCAPSAILGQLNDAFLALGVDDSFVTAACVKLDRVAGTITVANAGHVLPLVRRREKSVTPIGLASGPPVGALPMQRYRDEVFPVGTGDIVLLMTDGVLDAIRGDDDHLGLWSIIDLVARAPNDVEEIKRRVVARAAEGIGIGRAALDDMTLLAIEVA